MAMALTVDDEEFKQKCKVSTDPKHMFGQKTIRVLFRTKTDNSVV